jgi:hypothetical protein
VTSELVRRERTEVAIALAAALGSWLAAALAEGAASLSPTRAPSVLAALLLAWSALDASRALGTERALARSLTVLALPLLAPRLAAGDTDISGLALLVLAAGRAARGSTALASLASLAASIVHPPLAVWAPTIAALRFAGGRSMTSGPANDPSSGPTMGPSTADARVAAIVIAPSVIAALAVGAATSTPLPTLHPGGVALGLFAATWLLLPLGWALWPRALVALRETPLFAGAAALACALMAAFAPSPIELVGPAESAPVLADRLAGFLFGGVEGRSWLAASSALGAAVAGGLALSASQGARRTLALALSGGALASVAFGTSVALRDALAPVLLFLLLGPARSRRVEVALLAAFLALDLYLLDGLGQARWTPL